ncbi:MAG TPA: hypothetical protein VJ827_06280 [Rubrobacter sp.]|nr:hypothetical protein [Rubrobacter sp.]
MGSVGKKWSGSLAPLARGQRRLAPFPHSRRTLSEWLNLLVESGFTLEQFGEPYPDDEAVRERPRLQDARVVAYFLHVRTMS